MQRNACTSFFLSIFKLLFSVVKSKNESLYVCRVWIMAAKKVPGLLESANTPPSRVWFTQMSEVWARAHGCRTMKAAVVQLGGHVTWKLSPGTEWRKVGKQGSFVHSLWREAWLLPSSGQSGLLHADAAIDPPLSTQYAPQDLGHFIFYGTFWPPFYGFGSRVVHPITIKLNP